MALTSIGDRLTPSIPIEITFAAQAVATGTKITTLIGHMAATPGSATANSAHSMVNVADPVAALAEVVALAGVGSEIGQMAYAFVAANALAGRSTFPAFRVLMLDHGDTGIAADGIELLKHLRSDMIVSCYPASDAVNTQVLINLAVLISGPDRDLQGQFGSFVTVGSIDSITQVQAYNYNSRNLIIASLPDSASTPSQGAQIVAAAQAAVIMSSVFPYNPLKGVAVGGLIPPVKMADRVQIDPFVSSEALLVAGVSPMYIAPGDVVSMIKARTTYKLQPDGVTAVTDYNAWGQLVTMDDFKEELYQVCQNPPFNNNPGGTKASVAIADALLAEMGRLALDFEDQGAFQGVKGLIKLFQVAPSTLRRGRFDFKIPINVLPDLDVIAINIVGTDLYDFTL